MAVTLNSNALMTAAELDTFLQKTIGDSDYSNTLINFASDFIERYCNRILNADDYSAEVYDGNEEYKLYVKNPPINSVTTIALWDTYNNVSLQTYTEHLEFMIYNEEGYIYMRGKWTKGKRNYRLSYNGGYATIPYDLKKACADLCSWMKDQKDKIGIKSERIGAYSISFGKSGTFMIGGLSIPAEILSLLVNYRIINI